ncbi:hypothetical protein QF036_002587 [Arthrobacter globiformis]|nr:hypothetical protein [Arthrobacter globiformis]
MVSRFRPDWRPPRLHLIKGTMVAAAEGDPRAAARAKAAPLMDHRRP